MKRTQVFLELGKSVVVVTLGFLYFETIIYLTGFVAAHAAYPTWEHDVLMRRAFGEFTVLALSHDFLRYIAPALIAAYLTSLFRPARWLIYSLLLIGPGLVYLIIISWLYPMPAGMSLLDEPKWEIIYRILNSVILYGLPSAALWAFSKTGRSRFHKPQLHVKQKIADPKNYFSR